MDLCVEKVVRIHGLVPRLCDPEAIVAVVAETCAIVLGRPVPKDDVLLRLKRLSGYVASLARLLESPGIPQRTEAWYAARENMVTGSELASAMTKSSRKQFFKRKLAGPSAWDDMKDKPAIKWGVKYEPVACVLYSRRNAATVHEFGLLAHPGIKGFGASPDGISDLGIMLEIKCPYSRVITGEVPQAYWAQVQSQLDTTGLEECDFLEVKLEEYESAEEFDKDGGSTGLSANGMEKGAVWKTDDEHEVIVGGGPEALDWAAARPGSNFWRLVVYSCVRIRRDDTYIRGLAPEIESVVSDIARYRSDPDAVEKDYPAASPKASWGDIPSFAFLGH
jgi:putative phage-type endonuclease